jgi:hypothetical protein
MRARTVLLSVGIAVLTVVGISAPAQAQGIKAWQYMATYSTKSKCVDMGQHYQREGFTVYMCQASAGKYRLYVI